LTVAHSRCEDIVWLKPNKRSTDASDEAAATHTLTPIKEHCLMGIRGTVRRSTDAQFVHCNVDTDVIVAEPDPSDPARKPEELYALVENFCLGTRRLHLFAPPSFARPGWLAVGPDVQVDKAARAYDKAAYDAHFDTAADAKANVVPNTPGASKRRRLT
jgi:N6-adenosine-specific RNA methylase IME4